jgi:hypothetical protein
MEISLLEFLLNEGESTSLDFKRDQYLFYHKATDEEKSELLKDILAFANSWRRNNAYILIGVEEVKGDRPTVVGITSHLNDSDLQQFVNSKTNRPLVFSYETVSYKAFKIGVICIPLQQRPTFLLKKYGKLDSEKVYVREGSSTKIASLEDITKMALLAQKNNNVKAELQALIGELEHFIGTQAEEWYTKSRLFPHDQYQRLFSTGIISILDEGMRSILQSIYADIKNIDRLCHSGWGSDYAARVEALNEARRRFFDAQPKAVSARDALRQYIESL